MFVLSRKVPPKAANLIAENGGHCPPYERLAIPACWQAGQSFICNTGKFSKSSGKTLSCWGEFIPPVSIATQSSCGECRPEADGRDKPAPTLRLLDLGIGYRIEIHSPCTLSSFPRESRSYCPNFLRSYQYCRVGIAHR